MVRFDIIKKNIILKNSNNEGRMIGEDLVNDFEKQSFDILYILPKFKQMLSDHLNFNFKKI